MDFGIPKMISTLAFIGALTGCHPKAPVQPRYDPLSILGPISPVDGSNAAPSEADHVLVVMNLDNDDSGAIAGYYVKKRAIPHSNVVMIHASSKEEIPLADYKSTIEGPVREQITKCGHTIDYIVLTRGIPIRIAEGGDSVDAYLVSMEKSFAPIRSLDDDSIKRCLNPYFNQTEPFTHEKYGMYLVTRLTGYNVDDAKALVDRSLAAKSEKGLFFFDGADNRKGGGYVELQNGMQDSNKALNAHGFQSEYEDTSTFRAPMQPLAGYCSWGSNDDHFDLRTYQSLKFKPGAIAETFVSTSGRSFEKANLQQGQSNICDLIADGVTGVKGYVSEPYTFALARPQVLFPHYVQGQNLAEAFYSASLVLKWKDLVVGDPLCRPYRK